MFIPTGNENIGLYFHVKCDALYTECLKIGEFRIQSVVGDHFSSPNMEIKENRDSPHKDTLV
jgi:hypothetical protein